jgi:isoleucyl-tRNA synthetase
LKPRWPWPGRWCRLGRALRETHRLKTRQPLRRVLVVHHDAPARAALETHADTIAEELNVKGVEVVADDEGLATLSFKADFKRAPR